jgi:hypothetical protein
MGESGRGPTVVEVDAVDGIDDALDAVAVPRGRPVLVLVGGAGGMDDSGLAALDTALREAVLPVLDSAGATVVDGGTDAGVMRAIGRVRCAAAAGFPLVGVAAGATVTLPGQDPPSPDAAPADANHTHLLLVPGAEWGAESPWLARVATACAGGRPSVTLLVNGGEIAYTDVDNSLAEGRPVVVLAGTGRTADTIAAAVAGAAGDGRATRIADSGQARVVPVDEVDALRAALGAALNGG